MACPSKPGPGARRVRDWMTTPVTTITPESTLAQAIRLLEEHSLRRLPVVDAEGHLIGILSESDIRGVSPFFGKGQGRQNIEGILEQFHVTDQMSGNPVTIGPDRDLTDAIRYLLKGRFGCLPVLEGKELIGILTASDLLRALLECLGSVGGKPR